MKYDFILFENNTSGFENHFLDIDIIAELLITSGYSVAIANYANEKKYCKSEIPIIDISNKYPKPIISYEGRNFKTPLYKTFCYLRYKRKQKKYAKYFLQQVKGLANNFYCGTHTKDMSLVFLSNIDSGKNYYFWGLRSWWFSNSVKDILHNPFRAINTYRIKSRFKRFPNLKLFVSNEIIKNEFLDLGFRENQLVIRCERILKKIPEDNIQLANAEFTLLTIGQIRSSKNIELGINAFKKSNILNSIYIIAGESFTSHYGDFVNKTIQNANNIKRIDQRLNEKEYKDFICRSHFMLICEKSQKSTITSGTMMEALLNNRPIIAPNYLPFSYYIEKYNIGLSYDVNSSQSLATQILRAHDLGISYFKSYIKAFQQEFLIDYEKGKFKEELLK